MLLSNHNFVAFHCIMDINHCHITDSRTPILGRVFSCAKKCFDSTFFQKCHVCISSELTNNEYNSPCLCCNTFTGKEKDSETGFYYFGARYYDPSISGLFLSIDPMADKYPSISPYAYCAWNPVKLVDPDGRDLYIPNEDSESHNASKQDILSLVKEKYKKYICFDKEGNVSLSEDVTDGMLKNDKGLALIKDLVTSQKKFLYEASDDASSTYNDGLSHEMTSDEWTMDGIVNASSYGKDSRGLYTHTPKKGYDGHVILAKSGDWKETDKNGFATSIRKSVLFHELAENYYRTNNNMDYKEAHNEAVAREGFVFKRNFPGTIPRMSRSNPKDGFYYKGEHIF